ncbi:hypothetical protein KK083_05385 [Fulvivirgaceae bacterium PWU4]|uniref:Phytanoyl-CoA dioxygenase family protein n=1 Tax=Chryseosolibacter histidini TaxID=2782349 RepID=A0AAP2DJT4_9BACT|nr:hypothetical protein [Chryseosolibacter histidini]MBT1696297.1 hypothetical protein [Chryseosolibacter histidini]
MQYTVNNRTLSYTAEGNTHRGTEEVLLNKAVDLTAGTSWHNKGFTVEALFPESLYETFARDAHNLLIALWREAGLTIPDGLELWQYHHLAADTRTHLAAVEKTKLLPVEKFPSGIETIEKRIAAICGAPLKATNPFDGQSIFHFRVIRPERADNNPLHRDVWLEDYADCINLYIPVTGSNHLSSLIILPGSHLWAESKIERTAGGAIINGVRFNVPAVTGIDGAYTAVRPDPQLNEVLVFSPYLIHGGAANLNPDKTRISIELRLWKK